MPTNESSIKEALRAMLAHYRLQSGYHQARIQALWPRLYGKSITDRTRELRIRDRVLYVSVDSAPLRQELTMGRAQLCQRLNEELGENYLKEVVIR